MRVFIKYFEGNGTVILPCREREVEERGGREVEEGSGGKRWEGGRGGKWRREVGGR